MLELLDFVGDDRGFDWHCKGAIDGREWIELESQIWRGEVWRHDLVVTGTGGETCLLYLTGGAPNEPDLDEAQRLATRSGCPVAMLFGIPNQPLFDGRMEDDLIAYTFERFLDTGDVQWPLLFPMTRAAIRAMDALENEYGFGSFIVAGASKRGWTTWLTAGTGDGRIVGIAPMVFDNLNFPAQMAHQLECWGAYSEQIADYTSRGLPEQAESELGRELVRLVDPYHYLGGIAAPVLIINGANDRYWPVDALSLYWGALAPSRRCLIVPNAGHLLGDKSQMIETLSEFVRVVSNGGVLPEVAWNPTNRGQVDVAKPAAIRLWVAKSPTLDFRDSEWRKINRSSEPLPTSPENVALLTEVRFEGETGSYNLSAPVEVLQSNRA